MSAEGDEELAALTELVLALRENNRPGQIAALERRMRLAYYQGADERSQRTSLQDQVRGSLSDDHGSRRTLRTR
jgi:hypothetical protein